MTEKLFKPPWQPMSTAPKDGTRLVLFDQGKIEIGYWYHGVWGAPGGGWIIYENRSDTVELSPTAWMPLPDAPEEMPQKTD